MHFIRVWDDVGQNVIFLVFYHVIFRGKDNACRMEQRGAYRYFEQLRLLLCDRACRDLLDGLDDLVVVFVFNQVI